MSLIEAIRKIPVKVATGLHDWKRGYSNEGLQNTKRVFRGEITPDDRLKFRLAEEERLYNLLNGVNLYSSPRDFLGPPSIVSSLGIKAYLESERQLNDLPDDQIDQILAEQARDKLHSWHLLPKIPRIVKPSPPFI